MKKKWCLINLKFASFSLLSNNCILFYSFEFTALTLPNTTFLRYWLMSNIRVLWKLNIYDAPDSLWVIFLLTYAISMTLRQQPHMTDNIKSRHFTLIHRPYLRWREYDYYNQCSVTRNLHCSCKFTSSSWTSYRSTG